MTPAVASISILTLAFASASLATDDGKIGGEITLTCEIDAPETAESPGIQCSAAVEISYAQMDDKVRVEPQQRRSSVCTRITSTTGITR